MSSFPETASALTGPQISLLREKDLSGANRALIVKAAAASLQQDLDTGRELYSHDITVTLDDGRVVKIKRISCVDPVVRNNTHALLITKEDKPGVFRLPGGMKDKPDGTLETPEATARRETKEETGYIVPPDAEIRVLGLPRVTGHIRFYDPKHDPKGTLAKAYGLKEGDAFITDTIGIDIYVKDDLAALKVHGKETDTTKIKPPFLQAGDDALSVNAVPIADMAELAQQQKMEWLHYSITGTALLHSIVPADPLDLTGFLDPVALTRSSTPFTMFGDVVKKFSAASQNAKFWFQSRTLQATNIQMGLIRFKRDQTGIAGAAALITPGFLACGRAFIPMDKRKGVRPANPVEAETAFIQAAEAITDHIYRENREATPAEKWALAALMVMGVRELDAKAPQQDALLPALVSYLRQLGFKLDNNLPAALPQLEASVWDDVAAGQQNYAASLWQYQRHPVRFRPAHIPDHLDLSAALDPVALTGSEQPFVMSEKVAKDFREVANDPTALFTRRILQVTNVHMGQINFEREKSGMAAAAAFTTPGFLAIGRIFLSPGERIGIVAADPKFSETPFIQAAEAIAKKVYDEKREATPEEKKTAAQLMLMGIQYLESKAPGANNLLPLLIDFLHQQGYELGDNVPLSVQQLPRRIKHAENRIHESTWGYQARHLSALQRQRRVNHQIAARMRRQMELTA
jgi:ADP-ribose pyrophosphatase YjhB (NUDIX family)